MAGFKLLKRKGGVDEINHDFSDFSLASPATKIRRLDCGLPPIVEEDETLTVTSAPPNNEERALVLFKPIQHHSPSSFSLSLNSDLISQFNKNNQFAWSKQCDYNRLIELREEEEEDNNNKNRGLAIVPWVPKVQQQLSPPTSSSNFDDFDENNNAELMEADEIEKGMMMDVEPEQQQQQQEEDAATATSTFQHPMSMAMGEGFQQQQQHCLLPHLPQNTSTPITWTWTR